MRRGALAAMAIALGSAGLAIARGEWNQRGRATEAVTLALGQHGKLVTGGSRNSGQSVRLWIGPEGASSIPVRDSAWMMRAGFHSPERLPTLRRAYAVLARTDAEGLTVTDVDQDLAALRTRTPEGNGTLIAPVDIRRRGELAVGDTLGTLFLAVSQLTVPGGRQPSGRVSVRTGRTGVPFIVP